MTNANGFEGNSDLYGMGVRIGLYTQWIATLLVTLFIPSDEATHRAVNLVIQSAIFLGLCTESNDKVNAVGSVITMALLCGSLSSVTGDGICHLDRLVGLFRVAFYTALSAYGCWFWFSGIDKMASSGSEQIVFFGATSIHSGIRTFGKVVSVIGLAATTALTCLSVRAVALCLKGSTSTRLPRRLRNRPQVEIGWLLMSAGLAAVTMALVEYLIVKNMVSGVGVDDLESVGQLIPLVVGIVSLFLVFWKIMTDRLVFRKRCCLLFGCHL